jgi:crotonobetainyl-CoA:carnitine CoA-transferase CaiB-like acyl-CoA transferase
MMGNPAWASDPRFATRELRGSNERALNEHLDLWMATQKAEELFHACQQRRVCVTMVLNHEQLLKQQHLHERGFIAQQSHPAAGTMPMPGAPYRLDKPWWRLRSPAPLLGEANGQEATLLPPRPSVEAAEPQLQPKLPVELPLAGVRVLDLCWVWAGPYGTLQLAHLGAEVLKIESAARLDQSRRINIHPTGMAPGVNTSGYFNDLAQGKRSVAINLADPEGIALVKRLAAESDVVTSNFGTGVMERLGLGVEALRAVKGDLIIASISGFGQSGPCKDYIGYGNAMIALSGITASTGYGDGKPREVGFPYADPVAGVQMAFAIVAALAAKRLHGGGQSIDISLWEAASSIGFEGWINHTLGYPPHPPMANRDPWHAPYNLYRCAGEDAWVSIAVTGEAHWNALCQALGRIDWLKDERLRSAQGRKEREAELESVIVPWCRGKDRWEVTRMLQAARVPAFPCMSAKDLVEDPHLGARRYYTRLEHPVVGRREQIGIPWKLANRPNGVRTPAPLLGADTDAVLMSVLGISTRQVVRLWENKVLG